MNPSGISTSWFELFKIGPGPSSSHTIGPMRAAADFRRRLTAPGAEAWPAAQTVAVDFYGSLAATGAGHGSFRAAAAGLLGECPESCDIALLESLTAPAGRTLTLANMTLKLGNFTAINGECAFRHPNTMKFKLLAADGTLLHDEVYYSVGGGSIEREGEPVAASPVTVPYGYSSWNGFKQLVEQYGLPPEEILLRNELAVSGRSEAEIAARLDRIIAVMCDAVERGLATRGTLPGPIGLKRKAAAVMEHANHAMLAIGAMAARLDAFALAAAEENAAGHLIVTAPTAGSAGVMAAVVYALRQQKIDRELLHKGLMTAALIGLIVRHNGSISGAEVGCQGEIGVAAAMAAGMLARVRGADWARVESAAEIALEHHLGLACDPVGGFVQIPCIERNAMATLTACNACLLALAGELGSQKVGFDEVVAAMMDIGRAMSPRFRETAQGGLAICSLCS